MPVAVCCLPNEHHWEPMYNAVLTAFPWLYTGKVYISWASFDTWKIVCVQPHKRRLLWGKQRQINHWLSLKNYYPVLLCRFCVTFTYVHTGCTARIQPLISCMSSSSSQSLGHQPLCFSFYNKRTCKAYHCVWPISLNIMSSVPPILLQKKNCLPS